MCNYRGSTPICLISLTTRWCPPLKPWSCGSFKNQAAALFVARTTSNDKTQASTDCGSQQCGNIETCSENSSANNSRFYTVGGVFFHSLNVFITDHLCRRSNVRWCVARRCRIGFKLQKGSRCHARFLLRVDEIIVQFEAAFMTDVAPLFSHFYQGF